MDRRQILAALLATGLAPRASWADAGAPAFLAAAARGDGRFVLCGIAANREIVFEVPMPARGHAAAAHPQKPEAVAFARRPGTFAIVLDCMTGRIKAILDAPHGRHFYGHGVFSADGRWLYTTENDYEAGVGRIGLWAASRGYARVDEFSSGGVGPHDIKRLPGSDTLVIANGGIDTHPDSGRTKLNIPTMQPNLAYLSDGYVTDTAELPTDLHKNSIRHLAVARDGQVAFGMQWQGDGAAPPLVGVHRTGAPMELLSATDEALQQMQGYVGSIAFSDNEDEIVVTSPRGGVVQTYDLNNRALSGMLDLSDASGAAPAMGGTLISSGTGALVHLRGNAKVTRQMRGLQWDNHLVRLAA
ncbi:DUF1513 domain-containing protein [Cognatiyoonia sp. IB215182]|uniref:DUF1513 domain-containing protein n=1 Tax=Cognatiyoonia sp. IB215182 TaxID=3097353 RepID=UPI002A113D4B|nr:DUF1513 domain-containing protein [Cognatiyoonia sp. IB215182]MDX8352551.1 DUF1513 domain-containing protein [Cognatiyoonia sp. IB215182]